MSRSQSSLQPLGSSPLSGTGSVLPWTFTGQRTLSGAPFSQHAVFSLGKPGNPLPPPTHIRFCSNLLCPGFRAHPLLVSVRAWLGMCVSSFYTHLTLAAVNTSLVPAGRPEARLKVDFPGPATGRQGRMVLKTPASPPLHK